MERLRQRVDFLAAAKGAKVPSKTFILQGRKRDDDGSARVGFTVTKNVGNSAIRNRVRRRLREIVRQCGAAGMRHGYDYVVIGRHAALAAPFGEMIGEFEGALRRLHKGHVLAKPQAMPARP